jgi:hypothetical protein
LGEEKRREKMREKRREKGRNDRRGRKVVCVGSGVWEERKMHTYKNTI